MIDGLADIGLVKDTPDYLLAPKAWTDLRNVRLRDNKVQRTDGHIAVLDPPTIAPYWLLPAISPAKEAAIVYAGLTKVYAFLSATHTDITRVSGDYSATADGFWNGGILQGIPILNNGLDVPQFWANIDGSTKLADLTNWPAGWLAQVIRPYKTFLIAMDVTESGTRYIDRLRWSTQAQPGGVPSTWDDTDEAADAGIVELTDVQAGSIVDGVVLRDTFIVYKERSTWGLQFTGGDFVMKLYQIFENVGALGDHCATTFGEGGKHFVMTGEDLIIHDGQQILQSVIDTRLRRWLLSNISTTNFGRSFVTPHNDQYECWFCFPTEGADWPNLALIWNQKTNTVTFRELDNAAFIVPSQIPSDASDPWTGDTVAWDDDISTWDALSSASYAREQVQSNPTSTKLFRLDTSTQFNGADFTAYVERTGLSIYGADKSSGAPLSDIEVNKLVRRIYPRATGGPLTVQVGRQETIEGPVAWGTQRTFIPGTDQFVDVLDDMKGACKLFGVRYLWKEGVAGELRSYDVDVEPLGTFG